jgi:hypothetical protein
MRVDLRVVIAAAVFLPGCAGLVQDDWQPQPSHPPLAEHHIQISQADVERVCGKRGLHVYGCALRVAEARVCLIYTPPNPPEWLMVHERKHCAGWDHGPAQGGSAIVAAAAG